MELRGFLGVASGSAEEHRLGDGAIESEVVEQNGRKAFKKLRVGDMSAESARSSVELVGNPGSNVQKLERGIGSQARDKMGDAACASNGEGSSKRWGRVAHDGCFSVPAGCIFPVERGERWDRSIVVKGGGFGGNAGNSPAIGAHLGGKAEGHPLVHIVVNPLVRDSRCMGDARFESESTMDGISSVGKGESDHKEDADGGKAEKTMGPGFKEGKAKNGGKGVKGCAQEEAPTALPSGCSEKNESQ